jgi:peptidoglycan/LPS O-acetylase OafA/YrhL
MAKHYLVLDAARGLAALAVVLFHIQKYIYPDVVIPGMPHLFQRSFLAVDLFFLMSGLVIARSYETKLRNGRMSFWGFFRTRFVRLYPLYIIGTIFGFIYALSKSGVLTTEAFHLLPNIEALAANAFFLPSPSDRVAGIFPFDPAAWSLALEWAINVIYATWAVRQGTKRLAIVVAVSAVALVPCAIAYGSLDIGWGASTAVGGALRICFAFTLGVVIQRLLSDGTLHVPSVHPLGLLALLALALLTPIGGQTVYYDLFCDFAIFPIFVIFACCSETPASLNRVFAEAGRLSYALYILHNPLMSWFGGVWKIVTHQELAAMPALSGVPLLATVLIGSFLATSYFDEPVRNYLSSRTAKPKLQPASPS